MFYQIFKYQGGRILHSGHHCIGYLTSTDLYSSHLHSRHRGLLSLAAGMSVVPAPGTTAAWQTLPPANGQRIAMHTSAHFPSHACGKTNQPSHSYRLLKETSKSVKYSTVCSTVYSTVHGTRGTVQYIQIYNTVVQHSTVHRTRRTVHYIVYYTIQ